MQLVVHVPTEVEGGVYANFVGVWHTQHEFTLDFAVMGMTGNDAETGAPQVPVRVVSRVKVPPSVVFEIARAIAENVDGFEKQFGSISRPGNSAPLFPPTDD